jgi:glycine dehydrogenase subunit 2
LRDIVRTAKTNPDAILAAPQNTVVGRLDETRAARQPDLRWEPREVAAGS